MNGPLDPIEALEAHYRRLNQKPVPDVRLDSAAPIVCQALGGVAAGIAAVLIAVTVCLAQRGSPSNGGAILGQQMRAAGLTAPPAELPKHASRIGSWHI